MKMIVKGRVLKVAYGKKGDTYVTVNDVDFGGSLKFSIEGHQDIKVDSLIEINADVIPGISQYGQFLKVVKIHGKEA